MTSAGCACRSLGQDRRQMLDANDITRGDPHGAGDLASCAACCPEQRGSGRRHYPRLRMKGVGEIGRFKPAL